MKKIDVGCEVEKAVMAGVEQSALSGQNPMCRSKMATVVAMANGAEIEAGDWAWLTPDLIRQHEQRAIKAAGGTLAYFREQYECRL